MFLETFHLLLEFLKSGHAAEIREERLIRECPHFLWEIAEKRPIRDDTIPSLKGFEPSGNLEDGRLAHAILTDEGYFLALTQTKRDLFEDAVNTVNFPDVFEGEHKK
jgi:hypothetical protein